MKKSVLINGIGCTVSGSKYVLEAFVKECPNRINLIVFSPHKINNTPKNTKVVVVQHTIWGKKLRVIFELYLNLLIWLKKIDLAVNLSNYGICLTKNQIMYFHNPHILDLSQKDLSWRLKRKLMNTYLHIGKKFIVQTDHISNQLISYCNEKKISIPAINILYPKPIIKEEHITVSKTFKFELFYPASNFFHKRVDLAIEGLVEVSEEIADIGLVITKKFSINSKAIKETGTIPHEQVLGHFSVADALLFTSERESLGLPLLEALYYELPAVLPNLPYAREIYGNAAVYFENFDAHSVSSAIQELHHNYSDYKLEAVERKQEEWKKRKTWLEQWDQILTVT